MWFALAKGGDWIALPKSQPVVASIFTDDPMSLPVRQVSSRKISRGAIWFATYI